jgi:large subunit ribosomal protein L24
MAKLKVRKGDTVQVISGNSKGKVGKVLAMEINKGRVVVEGVGITTKHVKPSAQNPNGGIVKREASIDISNVALVDPSTNQTSRIGRKLNAEGSLQRYYKSSGQFVKNG